MRCCCCKCGTRRVYTHGIAPACKQLRAAPTQATACQGPGRVRASLSLSHADFFTLRRFLRARSYDLEKATLMWMNNVAFRSQFKVDTILQV